MKLSGLLILPLLQAAVLLAEANLRLIPQGTINHNLNNANSPILIKCLYPEGGSGGSGMTWLKDNSPLIPSARITVDDADNGKELSIQPVQEIDTGTYTCKANVDGQETMASITVNTYYGISVVSPANQYPVKGTDGKILCENLKPNANIEVKWYRHVNDVKERISSTNPKYFFENTNLIIRNIQLEDTGFYTCQLNMPTVGEALNFKIDVTVTMIPVFNTPVTLNPPNPKEGDRLVMTCKAEGIPEPRYTFNKKNTQGSYDPVAEETNGEYIIANVTRQNEGEYQCLATNKAGSATSVTHLDVSIPPKIMEASEPISGQEGNRVDVSCVATGKPSPNLAWKREGSSSEYTNSPNEEVYVERSLGEPELDAQTKVYRTTSTLVFRSIKASHAGTYVCEASNAAGEQIVPFVVDVTYKPNFLEQHTNQYWGWAGSNTNVTCIANGNPAPVILWSKGGQRLSSERGDHIIVQDPPPSKTKTISYLFPKPQEDNPEVYGEYTCEAQNRFGTNTQILHFQKAVVPAEPTVQITSSRPTELALAVAPPSADRNGGQEVTKFIIMWRQSSPAEDYKELTVNRNMQEQTTQVLIRDLTPNTQYSIKARAVNNVGPGNEASILDQTQDVSKPDPPVIMSASSGSLANSYTLEWRVPMTGGAPITNYVIEYKQILEADTSKDRWEIKRACPTCPAMTVQVVGQEKTAQELTGLVKDTYYSASISAVNRIGSSDPTVFVFRTGKGGESVVKQDENEKMAADSDYDFENSEEDMPDKEQGNELSTVSSHGHGHVIPGGRVAMSGDEAGPALGPGFIAGILVAVFLVLFIAVDAAFYKTKSCGLCYKLCTVLRKQEPGGDVTGKSPEEGDEAATKLLGKEKEDSLRTENEVAKETEPVEETGEPEEKKELEPEDKEEKPVTEVKREEPVKEKIVEAEVKATTDTPVEGEPTLQVETKPTGVAQADATANA